jgi:hypothetical protein
LDESRYLLHELRLENNKEMDEKKNLDSKASNIATYSVTFTVLLFGFGSFLLEKIETTDRLLFASMTSLVIIGVVLSIVCVVCSVYAFRLRDYRNVMSYKQFFKCSQLPDDMDKWKDYLDYEEIKAWINDFAEKHDYEDFMIKEHLVALRNNRIINDDKAIWIQRAQLFFIFAVSVIPLILLLLLSAVLAGILTIE